jgi:hypothetical protein
MHEKPRQRSYNGTDSVPLVAHPLSIEIRTPFRSSIIIS